MDHVKRSDGFSEQRWRCQADCSRLSFFRSGAVLLGVFRYNPCDSKQDERADNATKNTGNGRAQEAAFFFLFGSLRGGRLFGGLLRFVFLEVVIRKNGGVFSDFFREVVEFGESGVFDFCRTRSDVQWTIRDRRDHHMQSEKVLRQ